MEIISILKNKTAEDIVEDIKRLCKPATEEQQNEELYSKLKTHFIFRRNELEQRTFFNKEQTLAIINDVIRLCEKQTKEI
jgi:hypothetical protein